MGQESVRHAHSHSGGTRGRSAWAFRWFTTATALGMVHAADEAVLHRQPGTPLSQHAAALAAASIVTFCGVLGFRRARPGVAAGMAFSFGVLTAVNGLSHVIHIALAGPADSDVTGLIASVAGVALMLLGVLIPIIRRGEGARSPWRRWLNRAAAGGAMVVWVVLVLVPVAIAVAQTHSVRQPVVTPPDPSYTSVSFESSDGLRLAGWYRRSRNRAAVIIVSSAGGSRNGSIEHAELLASHGYGVLLYDARGTGQSQGSPNGYGWGWEHDVRGALTFVHQQPDVDPDRIGGLGLSTGADVLIEEAARDHDLAAVVCDGATARSVADIASGSLLEAPVQMTIFTAVRLFSGTSPGPPLRSLVADVSPTALLLIAAGSIPQEIPMNKAYAERAHEPTELWTLPAVGHTAAIREVPDAYDLRVTSFLDRTLRPTRQRSDTAQLGAERYAQAPQQRRP